MYKSLIFYEKNANFSFLSAGEGGKDWMILCKNLKKRTSCWNSVVSCG